MRQDDLQKLADHFGISLDPNEPSPPPRSVQSRSPDNNNPFKPEYRRSPREGDPAKWSSPTYRDSDAERVVERLSRKRKRKR